MVYRGHVENGIIRLEGAVVLPEGAEVRSRTGGGEGSVRSQCPAH